MASEVHRGRRGPSLVFSGTLDELRASSTVEQRFYALMDKRAREGREVMAPDSSKDVILGTVRRQGAARFPRQPASRLRVPHAVHRPGGRGGVRRAARGFFDRNLADLATAASTSRCR